MTEMGGFATAEHEGLTIQSNVSKSSEEILGNLTGKTAEERKAEADAKASEAASELGKRGGKAAAEKRKEKAEEEEEKPIKKAQEATEEPAEATEDEEAEAEPEKPTEKPTEEKQKERLSPARARVLEAARKEAEAKRERDKYKAELEALKAQQAAKEKPAEEPKTETKPSKPVRANFQTDEEYVEAVADWKAEEKLQAFKAEAETERKVKEYASDIDRRLRAAIDARDEYAKTDPEFMNRISEDVRAISLKPSFARDMHEQLTQDHVIADEIIRAGKSGPLLMLHLSDHPDQLKDIRELLTPQDIQVEMRILAKSLNGASRPAPAQKSEVSKALPPVRPVQGAPHNVAEEGHTPERAAKESLDDYRRGWRPAKRR